MSNNSLQDKKDAEKNEILYTTYIPANDLLKTYRTKMTRMGVGFFVETSSIRKTILSNDNFIKVLRLAMELAIEGINHSEVAGKYLQIKSICMQNKLFLKLTYSSELDQLRNHRYFTEIDKILDKRGGYVGIENGEEENVLKIAIPIK